MIGFPADKFGAVAPKAQDASGIFFSIMKGKMQVALCILLLDGKIISILPKKPPFTENPVSGTIDHIEGNDISTSASENNVATRQNGSFQSEKYRQIVKNRQR